MNKVQGVYRNHFVCLSFRLSICLCLAHNFFLVWHWLTIYYFAHASITMRGLCRVHSWSWFDIDLRPQCQIYRVYYMALCSGDSFFVLWHSHTMTSVWPWPLTSISKLYFHHKFVSGKMVFALWHRHPKFWHIGVSPWDNMLCAFLTFVWPWPLTYMWVVGGILSEFFSQFLSCYGNLPNDTCGGSISDPLFMIKKWCLWLF